MAGAASSVSADSFTHSDRERDDQTEMLDSRIRSLERTIYDLEDQFRQLKSTPSSGQFLEGGSGSADFTPKGAFVSQMDIETARPLLPEQALSLKERIDSRFTDLGRINGRYVVKTGDEVMVLSLGDYNSFIELNTQAALREVAAEAYQNPSRDMDLPKPVSQFPAPLPIALQKKLLEQRADEGSLPQVPSSPREADQAADQESKNIDQQRTKDRPLRSAEFSPSALSSSPELSQPLSSSLAVMPEQEVLGDLSN